MLVTSLTFERTRNGITQARASTARLPQTGRGETEELHDGHRLGPDGDNVVEWASQTSASDELYPV
jgi:hypothetical protein